MNTEGRITDEGYSGGDAPSNVSCSFLRSIIVNYPSFDRLDNKSELGVVEL